MFKITIEPGGKSAAALEGERLHEALARAGIGLQAVCGGTGTCGKCRIRILSSTEGLRDQSAGLRPTEEEKKFLSEEELADGWRLACQVKVTGKLTIEIPESSRLPAWEGLTSGERVHVKADPVLKVKTVILPEPSLEDQRPDIVRLSEAAGLPVSPAIRSTTAADGCGIDTMQSLPGVLKRNDYKVDAVIHGEEITGVLDPQPERTVLGIAIDIGTTTIAAELINLRENASLAVAAASNPQGVAGADVVSRIQFVRSHADGLNHLSELVRETLLNLLDQLLEKAGCSRTDVYDVVVAGNTTMLHLLLGIDPRAIAEVPFTPVFVHSMDISAEKLGIDIAPGARLHCLPCVSGYVGADIIAGLAVLEAVSLKGQSAGLRDHPALFIDIGTNGEIVLLTDDAMHACSTAAGPAFEGAKISCGMRAIPGAIDRVAADSDAGLSWTTIDGQPPQGICGSGLIDAAAAFLKLRLMEPAGNIAQPEDVPENLRKLIVKTPRGEPGIQMAPDVVVSQKDIRELQLAKGAVSAGASLLLSEAGIGAADITRVYIAGAFGSFIRAKSAVDIAIVPPGIPEEKIRFLGNSALVGARLGLISKAYRSRMEELARSVKYIELSGRPDFQTAFAEAMFFGGTGGGS